jgi:hypothetical protein
MFEVIAREVTDALGREKLVLGQHLRQEFTEAVIMLADKHNYG